VETPKKRSSLVSEKRAFRVRPINHQRYKFLVYRVENGQRVENRYFTSERAANAHAHVENIRLRNEGIEGQILGPELRGQAIEGARRLAPYGKTLRDAVDFYEGELRRQSSLKQIQLSELIREFLAAKEADRRKPASARYIATLRYRLNLLQEELGEKVVAEIEAEHITDFMEARQIGNTTWNNYRRDFSVFFNHAISHGYSLSSPISGITQAEEDPRDIQVLTPEQMTLLLSKASEEFRPVLALQAFAGLRRSEVERVSWSDINLETDRIIARETKSGKWRYVLIRKNLRLWLEAVPSEKRKGAVCQVKYREKLDDARSGAEIKVWPHNCLRHGFASYSLVAEENEHRLQMELGHSTPRLLIEHYRAIVTPAAARGWLAIEP
jgi:integrase